MLAGGSQAATVRVLPAPRELQFDVSNSPANRTFAKGDVLVRAFVLAPATAHLIAPVSIHAGSTETQITPQDVLVKGLIADISGSWLFKQKGQLRSGSVITYCTYREKSPIEQGVLFNKQSFERCLIDRDDDGRFDAFFVAGDQSGEPQQIESITYSLDPLPSADPANRIEVSFESFAGKQTIILQTKYFVRNKRRTDISGLLVTDANGVFDYQGGMLQGGRCFYRRPDESLRGGVHVLGVPVQISGADRTSKTVQATVGGPVPATLFVIDSVQRWGPTIYAACGSEPN
jgi:hypothetical protein